MNKMGDFWDLFHLFYDLIEKRIQLINTRKRGKITLSSVKVKFSHILVGKKHNTYDVVLGLKLISAFLHLASASL